MLMVLHGLSWLQWAAILAGLFVSVRSRYLSCYMPLVIAGFLGLCAQHGFSLSFNLLQGTLGWGSELILPVFAVSNLAGLVSWTLLVVGLTLVGRDLRDRFQFLREIHEERQPNLSGDARGNE